MDGEDQLDNKRCTTRRWWIYAKLTWSRSQAKIIDSPKTAGEGWTNPVGKEITSPPRWCPRRKTKQWLANPRMLRATNAITHSRRRGALHRLVTLQPVLLRLRCRTGLRWTMCCGRKVQRRVDQVNLSEGGTLGRCAALGASAHLRCDAKQQLGLLMHNNVCEDTACAQLWNRHVDARVEKSGVCYLDGLVNRNVRIDNVDVCLEWLLAELQTKGEIRNNAKLGCEARETQAVVKGNACFAERAGEGARRIWRGPEQGGGGSGTAS